MTATSSNSYVQRMDLIEMFHGDTITISFEFWYSETEPIDLAAMNVEVLWTLCPYGQYEYPAITKPMVISDLEHHVATVYLTIDDMANIDDAIKYTQQPVLRYATSEMIREYRRAEGDMLIRPRINIDSYISTQSLND